MARQKKIESVDYTTGELQDEINARAENLAAVILAKNKLFRHPLSRVRTFAVMEGESMTHQSHRDSSDINNIIRQFDRSGVLPPATRPAQYGDVSDLNRDLTELIEIGHRGMKELQRVSAEKMKAKSEAPASHVEATPSPSPSPADSPASPSAGNSA